MFMEPQQERRMNVLLLREAALQRLKKSTIDQRMKKVRVNDPSVAAASDDSKPSPLSKIEALWLAVMNRRNSELLAELKETKRLLAIQEEIRGDVRGWIPRANVHKIELEYKVMAYYKQELTKELDQLRARLPPGVAPPPAPRPSDEEIREQAALAPSELGGGTTLQGQKLASQCEEIARLKVLLYNAEAEYHRKLVLATRAGFDRKFANANLLECYITLQAELKTKTTELEATTPKLQQLQADLEAAKQECAKLRAAVHTPLRDSAANDENAKLQWLLEKARGDLDSLRSERDELSFRLSRAQAPHQLVATPARSTSGTDPEQEQAGITLTTARTTVESPAAASPQQVKAESAPRVSPGPAAKSPAAAASGAKRGDPKDFRDTGKREKQHIVYRCIVCKRKGRKSRLEKSGHGRDCTQSPVSETDDDSDMQQ